MIWFAWIAFEIALHYVLIVGLKKRPIYKYVYLWRFFWGAIFLFKRHPEFDPAGDPTTIFPTVVYAIFQASSFYTLFDPSLSLLRGLVIDYRGEESGLIDPKLSRKQWWLLKAASLLILILSIIVMYAKGY